MTMTSEKAEQPAIAGVLGISYSDPVPDSVGWRKERIANPPRPPKPEMFHGLLGEATRSLAPYVTFDPVSFYVQALACAATVAYGPRVREGSDWRGTNLFVACVAGTGAGKGLSAGYARAVGARISGTDFEREHVIDSVQSGEALVMQLCDEVVAEGDTDARPVSDIRKLLLSEELAQLLSVIGARGKQMEAMLTRAFDGRAISLRTRSLTVTANHPDALSIVGHITAEEFLKVVQESPELLSNGFLNRWMVFTGHRCCHLDQLADPDSVPGFWPAIDQLAVNIHEARKRDPEFTMTDAALDVLREVNRSYFDRDLPAHVEKLTARWRTHMVKLATLFSVLDGSHGVVDAPQMLAARSMWAYSERCVLALFQNGFSGDAYVDKFMNLWSARGYETLTLTDVSQMFSNNWSVAKRDTLLGQLERAGVLSVTKGPKPEKGKAPTLITLASQNDQTSSNNTHTDW